MLADMHDIGLSAIRYLIYCFIAGRVSFAPVVLLCGQRHLSNVAGTADISFVIGGQRVQKINKFVSRITRIHDADQLT